MKDHWLTPFHLMHAMITITIVLSHSSFKTWSLWMPGRETETGIETLLLEEVVEEETARQSLLTRCLPLVQTEMARDVLIKLK